MTYEAATFPSKCCCWNSICLEIYQKLDIALRSQCCFL